MLKDCPAARFQPYAGERYKDGIQGRRVLILGESHRHDCEKKGDPCNALALPQRIARHRTLTREVVNW
jgi:hypothetical protein